MPSSEAKRYCFDAKDERRTEATSFSTVDRVCAQQIEINIIIHTLFRYPHI